MQKSSKTMVFLAIRQRFRNCLSARNLFYWGIDDSSKTIVYKLHIGKKKQHQPQGDGNVGGGGQRWRAMATVVEGKQSVMVEQWTRTLNNEPMEEWTMNQLKKIRWTVVGLEPLSIPYVI